MIIGIPEFWDKDDKICISKVGFLLHYMDHLRFNEEEMKLALNSTLLIPKIKTLFDLKIKMIEWANQNKYFNCEQENNKYSINTHNIKITNKEKELRNDDDIKKLNNELLHIYVIFEKTNNFH